MRPGLPNNFILNGFDRSGSSAISRVLASHPQIELIMQPFNSGSIRKKLYQIMDEANSTEADYDFFNKLERGVLEQSYIKSDWHKKHSSVQHFAPGQMHLIKTTQNHFTIAWIRKHFPRIECWGIWRHPMDMLASLVRNDFHSRWYSGASRELVETVQKTPQLRCIYGKFSAELRNPIQEMAFILAVRSWFYFYYLDDRKIVFYEEFLSDRNQALKPVLDYFALDPFDFSSTGESDLNIVGQAFRRGRNHRSQIPEDDIGFCEEVFRPLIELVSDRSCN